MPQEGEWPSAVNTVEKARILMEKTQLNRVIWRSLVTSREQLLSIFEPEVAISVEREVGGSALPTYTLEKCVSISKGGD